MTSRSKLILTIGKVPDDSATGTDPSGGFIGELLSPRMSMQADDAASADSGPDSGSEPLADERPGPRA